MVCPGTYSEQVNVNKAVTLLGAQAGVHGAAAGRPGTQLTESIVDGAPANGEQFHVTDSDVVIDGFVVQGNTSPGQLTRGIVTAAGISDAEIRNNVITNYRDGIELGSSNTTIERNWISGGAASSNGIYSDQVRSGGALTNVIIDNNRFTGNGNPATGGAAIQMPSTTAGSQSNITISNNIMDGNARALLAANLVTSTFTRNEVSNSTLSGSTDVWLFEGVSGLSVTQNKLTGLASTTGFRAMRISNIATGSPDATGVTFDCNSIEDYTAEGLLVDTGAYSGSLSAEFNWWDSATGPTIASNPGGTGEQIVDPASQVDYTPFLTAAIDTDPAGTGFQCDQTPPTVTINQASTQNDPTADSSIEFDVVFSEPVTGFTDADVSAVGRTAGATTATVSGSGANYTVAVTGMTIERHGRRIDSRRRRRRRVGQRQRRLDEHGQHRHLGDAHSAVGVDVLGRSPIPPTRRRYR